MGNSILNLENDILPEREKLRNSYSNPLPCDI